MRKYLILTILITLSTNVFSQNRVIKGNVIDSKYHTPVPYSAVYIQGTRYGDVTNNVGEFSLFVPDSLNSAELVVAREGYKPKFIIVINITDTDFTVLIEPDDFEERLKMLQDSLAGRQGGFSSILNKVAGFVKDDWIPIGNSETNKFDFGRVQTIPTYNPIEMVRLRAGFASNSRLSPNLFFKGYGAYGFGDQKFKYRGEVAYSFDKKAYHDGEFPKNNINLLYENDLYSPGGIHPRSPNDLLLITYRRSNNESVYRNFAEVNFDREYKNGIAYTAWLRTSRMVPQGELEFRYFDGDKSYIDKSFSTSEVGLQLRYSVREAYIQQKRKRRPIEMSSPVFFLSHSIGKSEYLGRETTHHRTEFSAQKRFILGSIAHLDVVGDVMKVWNSVPFPLLVYPNQTNRFNVENNSFFLNRSMEFVADEQVKIRTTFVGDDLIFAKIPFINQFHIRELISLRASHGRLSDRNLPGSAFLYNFPSVSNEYGSVPYIEGSIGITNILGLLRVEYVHRFTYRDHPDALLGRVRFDITL